MPAATRSGINRRHTSQLDPEILCETTEKLAGKDATADKDHPAVNPDLAEEQYLRYKLKIRKIERKNKRRLDYTETEYLRRNQK